MFTEKRRSRPELILGSSLGEATKVIGTLYCPKAVWAGLAVSVPPQMSLGFNFQFDPANFRAAELHPMGDAQAVSGGGCCAAHFSRMLAAVRALRNGSNAAT